MQLKAKSRQNFQGVTTPAGSPDLVKLPSSTVRDRDDNGKQQYKLTYFIN